jgi:hypothetical protein
MSSFAIKQVYKKTKQELIRPNKPNAIKKSLSTTLKLFGINGFTPITIKKNHIKSTANKIIVTNENTKISLFLDLFRLKQSEDRICVPLLKERIIQYISKPLITDRIIKPNKSRIKPVLSPSICDEY